MAFSKLTIEPGLIGTLVVTVDGDVIDPGEIFVRNLDGLLHALYAVDWSVVGKVGPSVTTARLPVSGVGGVILNYTDNSKVTARQFRCTDCAAPTTLSISDTALNGDQRVDLSCGCRVRLARIRDRVKAGKVIS